MQVRNHANVNKRYTKSIIIEHPLNLTWYMICACYYILCNYIDLFEKKARFLKCIVHHHMTKKEWDKIHILET